MIQWPYNGLQFSYRVLKETLKPDNIHPFDTLCAQHNSEHRLTQFAHPWTNGQVEKMNHIIKLATLKLFQYENIDEYSEHLAKFLNYYNFENKLKSLKFKSAYDKILSEYKKKPSLFLGNLYGYCMGLNI